MTQSEDQRLEERLMQDAEDILEKVLLRRRWQAKDRDAIAAHLRRIVNRERKKDRS
jgi:hypothetical protein